MLVAVDRLRHCLSEVPVAFWPAAKPKQKKGAQRSCPEATDRDESTSHTSCTNSEDPDTDAGSTPVDGVDLTETEEGIGLPAAPDALSSEGSEPPATQEGREPRTDQPTTTSEDAANTSENSPDLISGEPVKYRVSCRQAEWSRQPRHI